MSVLRLFLFSIIIVLVISVALFAGTIGVRLFLSSACTMTSKREVSKDTDESATQDVVKQVSMSLPIYEDIKLFIEKEIN